MGLYLCIDKMKTNHTNHIAMNTENTLAYISSMLSSDASYTAVMDMINDLDLELMDICLA